MFSVKDHVKRDHTDIEYVWLAVEKKTESCYYNCSLNILGLSDVLPNFSFATSETERDY